jgi:hypothetical protein
MDATNSQTAQTRISYLSDANTDPGTDIFKYTDGVKSSLVYDAATNNIEDF